MATPIADKQQAIFKSALRLIAANGFHGTPMSKIAKEAGVSAGIIYHYFDSKDALIDALYLAVKSNFAQAVLANVNPAEPLQDQLRQLMENAISYFVAHPDEAVYMEQYMRSPYGRVHNDPELDAQYAEMYNIIVRAVADGIIKDLPLPLLYSFTLDVASSVAQKQAAGLLDLTDDVIAQVVTCCWDAIRP